MGYDVHITRREDWADTESPGISLHDWVKYLSTDEELKQTSGDEIKIGEEEQFQNLPGYCEWNTHPAKQDLGVAPWFAFWDGDIYTKSPDSHTIRKMLQIARAIGATVQGDDGEIYSEQNLAEIERSDGGKSPTKGENKKPWWQFW